MKILRLRIPPGRAVLSLLLVTVIASSSISCTGKGDEPIRGGELPFRISFPAPWEKLTGFAGTDLLGRSPKEHENDPFRENVSVEVAFAQKGTTLRKYFEVYVKDLSGRLEDFQELGAGTRKIGELDSRWVAYRYRWEGRTIQARLFILLHGTRVFGITCASTPAEFGRHAKTFEEIVGSFEPR